MVMMIISDFNKTIDNVMKVDTALRKASSLELDFVNHPEDFNSKRYAIVIILSDVLEMDFPETTQKVFSSSIETFNTIGNANFVNEVSSFYIYRDKYKEKVIDSLLKDIDNDGHGLNSLKSLYNVSFPEYVYINWTMLQLLKNSRDKCMQMMHVSEEDMQAFSKQQQITEIEDPERSAETQKMMEEFTTASQEILQAKEKLEDWSSRLLNQYLCGWFT